MNKINIIYNFTYCDSLFCMFHLPAVPVAEFVADCIERTRDGVVEWIWFSGKSSWRVHTYYPSICQERLGEFTKIVNKNRCFSQYRNQAPPEMSLLYPAANISVM
jgi:hypothetical protein